MEIIPEELQKRWAEKDRNEPLPVIAVIDLAEHAPLPPELDFLDDDLDIETLPKSPANNLPSHLESDVLRTDISASPWIDPIKLHGSQSVGPGTISIATYAPPKFSKTGHH